MVTAKKTTASAPKKRYDRTSSNRAKGHLDRLTERGGKRLPIDFEAESLQEIEELIAVGYAESRAAVVRKAITDMHQKHVAKQKKKEKPDT